MASYAKQIYCVSADPSAAQIENYNESTKRFEKFSEIPLKNRQGYGVVLHQNKIFIVGGWANNVYMNSVSSYDLEIKLYEEGKEEGLSEMKVARANATAIALGKYIYVLGGRNKDGVLDSCERFDTEKKSWETIKSMNLGRQHVAATVLNGNIYIAGGFQEGDGVKPNSVELYDPKTNEWTNVAPTNKCHGSSALIAFNGFLYTMGGFVGQVERFDPYENSWKEIGYYDLNSLVASLVESKGRLFAITRMGVFHKVNIFDREFRRNASLSGSNRCKLTHNSLGRPNYVAARGQYFLFHV